MDKDKKRLYGHYVRRAVVSRPPKTHSSRLPFVVIVLSITVSVISLITYLLSNTRK